MENTTSKSKSGLKFLESFTIQEIKARCLCSKIDIKKNPHTGSIFFVAGKTTGKVSKKGYANAIISECLDETTGETFLLLHSANDNNTIDSL